MPDAHPPTIDGRDPAPLGGLHHLTAITADAPGNLAFYTRTLGLRLVKKTVNQDDVSAYHLFYADGRASPGSDITFFDWPTPRERRGTRSVAETGFCVPEGSLTWWREHLSQRGVAPGQISERFGREVLPFEDPEGQRLLLVAEVCDGGHPWPQSPVPADHQIRSLATVTLSVPALEPTAGLLTDVLGFRAVGNSEHAGGATRHRFAIGPGGAAAELHILVEPGAPPAREGAGGVHHVALRTPDNAGLTGWARRLDESGIANSGEVERYYFRSLYFREPSGILFEIATDGPGFAVDEPMEHLGQGLALPPFLEPRRVEIEAGLKPLQPPA